MIKSLLPLLIACPFIFSSCLPDSNLAQQSVYSIIEISNSPPATYNFSTSGQVTSIQVLNGSFSYTADPLELEWLVGRTFSYLISVSGGGGDIGCADIEIRTYHNNNLIDTQNFQMGYTQLTPDLIFCDNLVASNVFIKTLDVEAN